MMDTKVNRSGSMRFRPISLAGITDVVSTVNRNSSVFGIGPGITNTDKGIISF